MRSELYAIAASTIIATAAAANAATVFSEDFDDEAETSGTVFNFNTFSDVTVTTGNVDLVESGDFSVDCDGAAGGCIDLDGTGSGTPASVLQSANAIQFDPGTTYTFSFRYSGSQRGGAVNSISYSIGSLVSGTISNIVGNQDFMTFSESFSVQVMTFATLELSDPAQADNIGAIIDNILITSEPADAIPLPAAPVLFLSGLAGVFGLKRRR